MGRKIGILLLAVIMLVICGSTALAAVVDENGTEGIQIDLNMTNQRFQLNGVAPKDDKGLFLVNGFKVYPPKIQGDDYYLTDNILTNVANAMYIRNQWPSLKQKNFYISDNHCYFGKGTNIIDFSKPSNYSYKGQQLLLPVINKEDLAGYAFEIEGLEAGLTFRVTQVVEKTPDYDDNTLVDRVPDPE